MRLMVRAKQKVYIKSSTQLYDIKLRESTPTVEPKQHRKKCCAPLLTQLYTISFSRFSIASSASQLPSLALFLLWMCVAVPILLCLSVVVDSISGWFEIFEWYESLALDFILPLNAKRKIWVNEHFVNNFRRIASTETNAWFSVE